MARTGTTKKRLTVAASESDMQSSCSWRSRHAESHLIKPGRTGSVNGLHRTGFQTDEHRGGLVGRSRYRLCQVMVVWQLCKVGWGCPPIWLETRDQERISKLLACFLAEKPRTSYCACAWVNSRSYCSVCNAAKDRYVWFCLCSTVCVQHVFMIVNACLSFAAGRPTWKTSAMQGNPKPMQAALGTDERPL